MKVGIFGSMMNSEDRVRKVISILNSNNIQTFFINEKKINTNYVLIKIMKSFYNGLKLIRVFFKSDVLYVTPGGQNVIKIISAKLFRKKIICDFYFSLYDTAVNDRKRCKNTSLKGRIYKYRDIISLKYSDLVFFLNEAEAIHYCNSVCVDINFVNYEILPLCRENKEEAQLNFYNNKNKTKTLNLCWTGTFIPLHGLEKIIQACKLLLEEKFDFILYIIGPNTKQRQSYELMINDLKMNSNIKFIDLWGNTKLWEEFICKNCDISFGIFGDSEKAKSVVANKVIDGIAFKTPIITGESKGISIYFNGNTDIYVVKNTPDKIAEKIIELSKLNWCEINKNIVNAYRVYEKYFSEDNFKNKLISCLQNI